jgi:hypothetical protein
MMKFLHWIKFNNVKKENQIQDQDQCQGKEDVLKMSRIKQQISLSSGKRDSLFGRMDNVVGELKAFIGSTK